MQILVLKTSLKTREAVHHIGPILDLHPSIKAWTVDTEDIDNVLRIETNEELLENQIIHLLQEFGVQSEILN